MKAVLLRLAVMAGLVLILGVHVSFAQQATVKPPVKKPAKQGTCKQKPAGKGKKAAAKRKEQARQRAKALRAIAASLGVGQGATIADIGAGKGRDTWVFADIVGASGAVYSEEIIKDDVKIVRQESKKRGLSQVHAVEGGTDDPRLPPAAIDMAYMHYVYHHFTKPREMLRGIWKSLKPGGYLVVVDRHRGTLRDWVARERRGKKHFWLAETTVVREAREEGYAFVRCAEDCWPKDDQFVLVFQRPPSLIKPGSDPDLFPPLNVNEISRLLLPKNGSYQRVVFIALGEARKLIGPIMKHVSSGGLDVVLEEWATQKDERSPLPAGVSLPSTLTENGDPRLGPEPVDAIFFLDSYHLLFHEKTLLAKLHERLSPNGRVFILDRQSDKPLSRRLASHRRRIPIEMVKQEMRAAGFSLLSENLSPGPARFLLVFGKRAKN